MSDAFVGLLLIVRKFMVQTAKYSPHCLLNNAVSSSIWIALNVRWENNELERT
jgi:hypothetical protein